MIIKGQVEGPNKPGQALEAVKEAMQAATTKEENPLKNVRLTRSQREQAQQYFDLMRDGESN